MNRYLKLIVVLLFPVAVNAQDADSVWIVNHFVKKERYIPMRDGIKLYTAIYMPTDSARNNHPILLLRTPYSAGPYGKQWIPFWKVYVKEYLKAGYNVVLQDVRGRYMSQGDFVNVRPFNPNKKTHKDIDEASDAYDTIDWLVKNIPGNNGKVGAIGTSYPGFYTAMAGLSGHPALKAISPQAPVSDWFAGDDFHHNGAFMLIDAFNFFVGWGFGVERPAPTTKDADQLTAAGDAYSYYLDSGALPNLTKIANKLNVPFWKDMMNHPDYDAWWQSRNDRQYAGKIPAGTASLVVGGLFDAEDCFGAVNLYQAIEDQASNNNKFVFGPWHHGQWGGGSKGDHLGNIWFGSNTSEWYIKNIELPFFNYYLKGTGSPDSIAEATVFFTGENKWHKLSKWPPQQVQPTPLYFHKGGKLSFTAPKEVNTFEKYVSDPAKPVPYTDGVHQQRTVEFMDDDQRFAATRTDVLTFETDTLTNDITLAGPLTADLKVSISTTDADVVVKLIDVFPDDFSYSNADKSLMSAYHKDGNGEKYVMGGYQMLVRGDIVRGRYRNSLTRPQAFVPGRITQVKYTLNDVAHTFKKGHRIMVQVQSSWFPLADRNPQQFIDIYHAKDTDFIKSTIKIYMCAGESSNIILPVLQ